MSKFRDNLSQTLPELKKQLGVILKDLKFEDNFRQFKITDETVAASTEAKFRNQLNVVPSGMIIIKQTGNALVTAGDTAWDKNFVYIKNHDGSNSATVSIIFFR